MSALNLQHAHEGQGATDTTGADPRGPHARLRAQRRLLEEQGTRAFEHPGYHGMRVTYRRLSLEESNRILWAGDGGSPVERNLLLLVEAATMVEATDEQDVWQRISGGYDRKLGEALEVETDPEGLGEARQVCLASFGGHEQPMLNHAAEVYAWMQTLRRADEKSLLGG